MASNRFLPTRKSWQTEVYTDTKLPYLQASPPPHAKLSPRSVLPEVTS